MRKLLIALLAVVLLSSHDMFLKPDNYFLPPAKLVSVRLYNGTYEASENTIDRNRMLDVSRVEGGKRTPIDTAAWREEDNATVVDLTTFAPGTMVVGVSTRARNIEMDAEAFNRYLDHDGVLDMIALREREGKLGDDAVEKYSKHVKTILQVGDRRTDDYRTELGYPIEFIPQRNPYDLAAGDTLPVRLLRAGRPLAGVLVYAGLRGGGHTHDHGDHDHDHEEGADHDHSAGTTQLRTDDDGLLHLPLTGEGNYFLRTIHLVETEEEGLTHESNWATLTFSVGHQHGAATHTHADGSQHGDHEHAHDHEGGLPAWAYWLGSLLLITALFFYFRRRGDADLPTVRRS